MRVLIFLALFATVYGGKSPNGEAYLSSLPPEILSRFSSNIIEDSLLDAPGLIKKYGYPVETHEVRTEDNYLLTVHRIPYGKHNNNTNRIPVFLMHGLLSSSADWIVNGPESALGYVMADQGFDVWMGNARGNTYSRRHVSLNPNKSKFWKFSWNEIGQYDLPAMIDYVLKKIDKPALHYVGHSQGTTTFFVMTTNRKDYNKKIKSMHALAPVAYMGHLKSPLVRMLAPMSNTIAGAASLIGANEFLPNSAFMTLAAHLLCGEGSIMTPVCSNVLFLLCGFNPDQLNTTMLPLYMSHTPAGSSSRQMVHYGQEHMSKKFRKYDHLLGNLAEYGSFTPPKYNLKSVTAPVALHYSENDWMSSPTDVDQLSKEISYLIGKFKVPMKEFNHLDFMWGIDAKTLIYNRVMNLIEAFD